MLSTALLVIQTTVVAAVLVVLYKVVRYIQHVRHLIKACQGLPGPKDKHWLFGTFVKFPEGNMEKLHHYLDICNNYGDKGFVLMWGLLRKPIIVCCSPKFIGKILKTAEPKPVGFVGVYRFMEPWLGKGLLIAGGKKWARNRRLLTPAFHFDILKPYVKIYNRSADTLLEKLHGHSERGERFELCNLVSQCTLDSILKCAFSYNKDVQGQRIDNQYMEAVNRLTDTMYLRLVKPAYFFDFIWYLSEPGRQFRKDCDYVHAVAEEIIEKRRMELESSILPKSKHLDFLDILLTARDENNEGLSPLEIRNEVDTFLFEGHDTTASAIFWILYSLAEHEAYQRRCQEEIDELLKDRQTEDLEWSDMSSLDYVTMCIKEGLRLHSPVPIVSRETQEEFDIGDRKIPKGVFVQINIVATHHMEKYWPDHMTFDPERFSKENIGNIEPFQFVPFAGGPRNCIGQNFAMNEIKVVVSRVLRRFTLTLDPNHSVKQYMSGVMRSENGIYVFAKQRS